jgi:hypothetical protein
MDNSIIINPVQVGNLLSEACNYQYTYLQRAIDYVKEQLAVISSPASFEKKPIIGNFSGGTPQRVYGFKIKNPKNLYSAWRLLRNDENKFITKRVTYDTFERNFIGKTITQKITWSESENCLHYFIDGIAGNLEGYGIGIEKEEGGKWIKASQVFEKEDGSSFDSEVLSHANRKPSKNQIERLNPIIIQMNKPSKKD